jgi:hypothetical protein
MIAEKRVFLKLTVFYRFADVRMDSTILKLNIKIIGVKGLPYQIIESLSKQLVKLPHVEHVSGISRSVGRIEKCWQLASD